MDVSRGCGAVHITVPGTPLKEGKRNGLFLPQMQTTSDA
jgi:hypothetical protein